MADDEQPLDGGNLAGGVVRVGDSVRRSTGPWTPSVHRLLRHLEARSYDAPRVLGVDTKGRESLSFVPGVTAHPHRPTMFEDAANLERVGRLVAAYHAAQQDFVADPREVWRGDGRDPTGPPEVIAHNDLAPWNLIVHDGRWVFIDWDLAAPGRRLWDLAWALQSFASLWPDDLTDEHAVERIAAFCRGAAVRGEARHELLDVTIERTATHAAGLRRRASAGEGLYVALVEHGHADRWEQAAQFVSERRRHWITLLAARATP